MIFALLMSLSLLVPGAFIALAYIYTYGIAGIFEVGVSVYDVLLFHTALISIYAGIGLLIGTFEIIRLNTILTELEEHNKPKSEPKPEQKEPK